MNCQYTLQMDINDCPGDKDNNGYCQSRGGLEREGVEEGEIGIKRGKSRWRNMQGMAGDDVAHRQTAPTGHCLLCVCGGLLFRSLLTS